MHAAASSTSSPAAARVTGAARPAPVGTLIWPPDFAGELRRRMDLEARIANDPALQAGARLHYANDPVAFINDCVWLYEPRNANQGLPTRLPLVLFPRQVDFVEWLHQRALTRTSAPVEKSRDSGATWLACAFAVWWWLYKPGSTIGFGSRKEALVDRKGDPQSILEKVRQIIGHLPPYLLPVGWSMKAHTAYMKIINPANNAAIVGEAGDNIGRGGRSSIYIVDEAAHLERPHMIEASLTANTDCRIDISSVDAGSLFNEWCASSVDKFIFDVSDAPWHTPEWIARKRHDLESKGMEDAFRREYLRDLGAGSDGQLIKSDWIEAAIDLCDRLGVEPSGETVAALDVADGGRDASALVMRYGIDVFHGSSRRSLRADQAGRWAHQEAAREEADLLRYDNVGVGAGAAAVLREHKGIGRVVGWSGAGEVVSKALKYEGNRTHGDMFANAKSQGWWMLRQRFMDSYRYAQGDTSLDPDSLISLSSSIGELRQMKTELSQIAYHHTTAGKILIDKSPEGHRSPNLADALMMCMAPEPYRPTGSLFGGWV